jgi:hypothetical protein
MNWSTLIKAYPFLETDFKEEVKEKIKKYVESEKGPDAAFLLQLETLNKLIKALAEISGKLTMISIQLKGISKS